VILAAVTSGVVLTVIIILVVLIVLGIFIMPDDWDWFD
jgi:hypothetical protein